MALILLAGYEVAVTLLVAAGGCYLVFPNAVPHLSLFALIPVHQLNGVRKHEYLCIFCILLTLNRRKNKGRMIKNDIMFPVHEGKARR